MSVSEPNTAFLWTIPALPLLPLLVAAVLAVYEPKDRRKASLWAIGALGTVFAFSLLALIGLASKGAGRMVLNFTWFEFGSTSLRLGWVLDPLSGIMLVMITFVGTLIFIFSTGYMSEDGNYRKFFCYLSLFAAAMLGLVISNNLLMLFICWELVGLASYLLIGFWYHKPEAAAAAKKAFITTRIGDLGLFLGMLWLYSETGTLLFYDGGNGCLEQSALSAMVAKSTLLGMTVSTAVSLLIFCGAIGKSGQVPLHVWLPDAMEGPTPVSALIHAATMVAAGVFLMARVYPLISIAPEGVAVSGGLQVMAWVGAATALFGSLVAIGQFDIKRILAYSTVAQLGYMFMGLAVGGVAVGMFHLITHAFFKALLFLGAGSVIHGCHHEQDIRKMGGLRKRMLITYVTYAVGMVSLAGLPGFAGFWSKDEILHSAWSWPVSTWPFWIGLFGAFLTAFYMTRQMAYVFFGDYRGGENEPHESPINMWAPLAILAASSCLIGLAGTPFIPLFQSFLDQAPVHNHWHWSVLGFWIVSMSVVAAGLATGWWFYGVETPKRSTDPDELEARFPKAFGLFAARLHVDEFYRDSVLRLPGWLSGVAAWLDRKVFAAAVGAGAYAVLILAWLSRFADEYLVNPGFDKGCAETRRGARFLARLQNGQVQEYLRVIGAALALFILVLAMGNK
ncbi:MAG: NADH-quinone oxidoreductase subunit L [Verrucomicrobiae bacterium]|nr:NADH-quinone oxidoreductase subunit L [Verrucomicrobiae bacterium]